MEKMIRQPRFFMALALLIFTMAATVNPGFIALDEYFVGITRYIPAQSSSLEHLVGLDDVKSPTQLIPFYVVSQAFWKMGIENPFTQYHATLFFWAVINALILILACVLFWEKNRNLLITSLLLLAFHFAGVGLLTRPMFESMSAPWIALVCAFAYRYEIHRKHGDLLWGAAAATMAFLLRPQTALCALIFLIMPLVKRDWRGFAKVTALGVCFFVLAGLPDLWLRGGFHYSLKAVATYNVANSESYNVQPWYFYFPLLFVVCLGPWMIRRYDTTDRQALLNQRSVIVVIALFLTLHLMFSHKYERFLIPIIPACFFLLTPFIYRLWQERSVRKGRWWSLLVINFLLWFPASFSPSQANLIRLAKHHNAGHAYQTYLNYNGATEWLAEALMSPRPTFRSISSPTELKDCQTEGLLVKKSELDEHPESFAQFRREIELPVNIFDRIAYKLNPKRNQRRSPLVLLSCRPS